MNLKRMERIKLIMDVGVTIFGLLAAVFAIFSLIYASKLEVVKKIEEQRLKSRIAEANASAEKAKEEAAKAFSNAANSIERSKKLELQVETQKVRAADAEKELFLLKQKVKPRQIPTNESLRLINDLQKFSFKEVMISSSLGDGEAANYANQIKHIFESAGWKVDSGIGSSTYTGDGIFIMVKNIKDDTAVKLQSVFAAVNINLKGQHMPEGPRMQIFVGSKIIKDADTK